MKNFLLIFSFIFFFASAVLLSSTTLSAIFFSKEEKQKYTTDLGFALEEVCTNQKRYREGNIIVGESVELSGNEQKLNEIVDRLGVNILQKYVVGNNYIIEGFSPKLKFFIEGRQANVQISLVDSKITIGSPIIYGSY